MVKAKVFVVSFGCASSFADGSVLAGCLAEAGYEIADELAKADVVVVNTCAVKGPTENRMISFLKKVPRGKRLIVAGCLPLINFPRLSREVPFDGVVGPAFGERIVEVVERVLRGERVIVLQETLDYKPALNLPCLRRSPLIDIVPIAYGCLGECAYCCVRFARGRLRSYRPEEVVERVRRGLKDGVKEFWLCAQDTAVYGWDVDSGLPELLERVCSVKDAAFIVRVGMMRPDHALRILDELVDVYVRFGGEERFSRICEGAEKGGCLFWFLHLPIQSGDDEVLAKMRRGYGVADFRRVVDAFRRRLGDKFCLSTDIIVGFPGETDAAFRNTLRLVEEVKPDVVNVSKFFTRPGTEAERMRPKVDSKAVKERSRIASELALRVGLERNREWLGWEGYVFIDEEGLKPNTLIGRNYAYKPVAMEADKDFYGKFLKIRVEEVHPTYLRAIVNYRATMQ